MKISTTGAWTAVALGGILAAVLLLSRSTTLEAVYPIERAKSVFSRSVLTRIRGLFRGAALAAENAQLKREIAALSLVQGDLERIETENARLRRLLNYMAATPEKWLAVPVFSEGGGAAAARRTLRVGKGTLDGVCDGAVVVVPEGLVGRVTAVSPHTAEVTLILDSSVKVACEIETGSRNPPTGILAGGSEERLVLRHLHRAEEALPRARVVTSGLGGVFPRGCLVGDYLSDGEVQPAVDFSALEDVFIRCEK